MWVPTVHRECVDASISPSGSSRSSISDSSVIVKLYKNKETKLWDRVHLQKVFVFLLRKPHQQPEWVTSQLTSPEQKHIGIEISVC